MILNKYMIGLCLRKLIELNVNIDVLRPSGITRHLEQSQQRMGGVHFCPSISSQAGSGPNNSNPAGDLSGGSRLKFT